MKNNLFLLVPILFYTILSFSQNSTTDSELCKELSKMLADDQKYRGSNLNEIYPILLDSLISEKGINKEDFDNLPEDQIGKLRMTALQIAMKKRKSKTRENDSLRVAQQKIDEKNTERLIVIIKERGWFSSENKRCSENVKTALIFRHSPEKYWKEIRELIEKEKNSNRLSENEYQIIDDHLKGRPTNNTN